MSEPIAATELPFQAEVQQVLSLVIHSLYANSEVFLRELISNASDALDKGRFLALTREDVVKPSELAIRLKLDETAGTLTISDNGIGMNREEVVENLGTIAKSGSVEFLKAHAEAAKKKEQGLQLIGQFGVGFYAAFMVASRVDVHTKSLLPGSEAVIWRSSGAGTFSVSPGDRTEAGTDIVLHLKEEEREYAKAWRVKEVLKKYSDFVHFPIYVNDEQANRSAALWALPRTQVTEEQHGELFRHLTSGHEGEHPLLHIHYDVDAPIQFHALLYIPEKAPDGLFAREAQFGVRLYAKRVLIMEKCEKILPPYLRFLRGVVDSEDLPLNVSREALQENKTLPQIETQLTKQVLKALRELAESDADKYAKFWGELGRVLKEGIALDWKNKDAIADLARFESMKTEAGKVIGLKQYIAAMPEDQKEIFYVTGVSRAAVERSPHLEAFKRRGFDVLFFIDPVDEWVAQSLPEFEKKTLRSVTHGELDLGTAQGAESEAAAPESTHAIAAVKKVLGDRVKDVRVSQRLTDSASCLVADADDPGANFERLMKMMDKTVQEAKRVLELNAKHPIIQNIEALAAKSPDSPRIAQYAEMLFDQAMLAEGIIPDPAALVKRMTDMLVEVSSVGA